MKSVQRAILQAVGRRVASDGFEVKPTEQSFLRRFRGGRASLHLAFVEHAHDFDVVADVAVRLDELEKLVYGSSTLLTKREKEQTYSLGAELGNISGEGQRRWQVTDAADTEQVADDIVASFREVGRPYLEAASSLEGAYRLLASPGRGAWLHSPIHASRAKRVVGLAKLLARPEDELRARVSENIQLLEALADPSLQDLKRFLAIIGATTD
jgi:hypothetical protein